MECPTLIEQTSFGLVVVHSVVGPCPAELRCEVVPLVVVPAEGGSGLTEAQFLPSDFQLVAAPWITLCQLRRSDEGP